MEPYYDDGEVRLYLADCRDVVDEWVGADFLLTDPPYGRNATHGNLHSDNKRIKSNKRDAIVGDESTEIRDWVLSQWGDRPGVVFGDLMLAPPSGTRQVLIYKKPPDTGLSGYGGFNKDTEAVYLIGPWSGGISKWQTSILETRMKKMQSGKYGYAAEVGHRHAKPIDVLQDLLEAAGKPMLVADPFAGSGSTLLAARMLGLHAVGVEVDEQFAERAARRLRQPELF
jgi:site-specific DNA-methyltransferase (adenine-specific)